ncbi:MAG TPA: DNA-processing protein DprA [Candidatus Saccharicenans sp.]|nr:DNA-processing protein DprA [Candidatus Saccharicenans sp.]HRD01525.1 DNA-processing protein DprA [Candidatus Saccharicenans sp.]
MRIDNHRVFWLALNFLVTDGYLSAGKALRYFDSEDKLLQPEASYLSSCQLSSQARQKILSGELVSRASFEVEKLRQKEYTLLSFKDSSYPELLREIVEPPLVLYAYGQTDLLNQAAVAIVGSRHPTSYGRLVADKLADELAACGLIVTSGLARGIDTLAHQGALRSGKTLAVLGSGLDRIYPRENRLLAEKIAAKGLVISEFPLDSEPLSFHFPLRNRVLSGLSLACLVVEAGAKSGALITARLALDQGREVMAVPGPVTSELSRGTNLLIKHGAKLVESAEDIVSELPFPWNEAALSRLASRKQVKPELNEQEKKVMEALPENSVIHIDELSDKIQISVGELLTVLLSLEMKETVIQEPGKFFRRRH